MNKTFTKALILLAIFVVFASGYAFGQTITIGTVDPGPYAPGSSITAPISVTGTCVNTSTSYALYLSNAAGSFAAPKLIGTFGNFYATFVNGIIPAGTPAGAGYKLEVISASPTVTSTISGAFTIGGGTGVVAAVNSQVINPAYPEVFGTCSGVNNTNYIFTNQSTAGAAVTASFFDELAQSTSGSITPTAAGTPFTATLTHYTITVRATKGGVVGTQSYLLINNTINTSFGKTGGNAICLAGGGSLTYNVDVSSPSGIQNNFPGLFYTIIWGDGSKTTYTLCDIIAAGGQVTHNYTQSSCGVNATNTFTVSFQPSSLYCGNVGTPSTNSAQVVTAPVNSFTAPVAGCANAPTTFINTSDPGEVAGSPAAGCKNNSALYTWSVDGVAVASNYPLNKNFIYTFTTTGQHTVLLHLQNPSALCGASDIPQNICIQNPPQPVFTLPVNQGCLPITITPGNTSVIDANCNASNQYVWTVTGPAPVTYAGGTNANSAQPQFVFPTAGVYQVQLGITTVSCGTILAPMQIVTVNAIPVAQLSPDIPAICGINQTFTFDQTAGSLTQTTLNGSAPGVPGTYLWTVSGGAYSFTNGTSATSQYPQINFTSAATYKITVTNTNICGTPASSTQHITFVQTPTVTAGTYQPFCANQTLTLTGTVMGAYTSSQWTGGTGTFTPNSSALTAAYAPSAAEIAAGTVTLNLQVSTGLPAPCDIITSSTTLTITPQDAVNSTPTAQTCSGVQLNYPITATMPNSTFSWTVDPANTSASASGYAASGSGNTINDILVNNNPAAYSTVTYDIIAVGAGGCNSNPFVLTVTIAPKTPIASFTQNVTSGCGSVTVQFTNTSTPANSTYTWDFGDGSPTVSTTNPSHTYLPGTTGKDVVYNVTLSIQSPCGSAQSLPATVTVSPATPVANITPTQLIGCSPFNLVVNNTSPGTNQSYTFYLYDATNTLVQPPITVNNKSAVTFNPLIAPKGQIYSLYMVATDFCGNTSQSNVIPITVSPPNVIAQMFEANAVSKGCAPLSVNFVNNSVGGTTYQYNIYDANHVLITTIPTGTAPLPYTFTTAGTYFVDISGSSPCATNITSAPDTRFDVYPIPAPQFAADVTTGCRDVLVTFTNNTPPDFNTPAASLIYDWDFGDGSAHAFTYQPTHVFHYKNSPFTVKLTATNSASGCSSSVTLTNYINISAPPFTAFSENPDSISNIPNYHYSFYDQTTGNPVSWKWTFGDGSSSTSQNPAHTYLDSGSFKVTLTTTTKLGCDSTIIHGVKIIGIPGQLYFPNAFEPDGNTPTLRTFMALGSGIKEWHMQIFNNYSQLVWETTKLDSKGAPMDGWDGTFNGVPAPQGVYVWQASATFINGSEWKGNVIKNSLPKRTGVIHLIR